MVGRDIPTSGGQDGTVLKIGACEVEGSERGVS